MKTYKDLKGYLIAVDLDNTIVSGFDTIDKKSFEILKYLAKDNYVIIASGRPWRSSRYFYKQMDLHTPIINYNGAYVHHPYDDAFTETYIGIDKTKLQKFVNDNSDILINVFSEIRDNIYLLRQTKEIEPYLHLDGGTLHTGNFSDILPSNPNGAILFTKIGSEEKLANYVNNIYKDVRLRFWFVNDCVVSELYNPLTSKAAALEKICKYYNIDRSKTIAIGDGHNDIEMIDFAHYGVAMGDSHPELLKHANIVTKTEKESGVFEFFNTFNFED